MSFIPVFMRRYYLRKICKKKISAKEVARIYNTSVENVENAVKTYENSINPFQEADAGKRQGAIQIVVSVLSSVLILFTLFEMQAERNATYLPTISANSFSLQLQFIWDETIWEENGIATSNPDLLPEEMRVLWNSFVTKNLQGNDANIEIQNNGVGVAKDVSVDWFYDINFAAFQKTFSGCDDISIDYNPIQVVISIQDPNSNELLRTVRMHHYYNYYGWNELFRFLPASFDRSESVRLPQEYLVLYELACARGLFNRIPTIRFALMCKDVQGEQYIKEYNIKPESVIARLTPDGTRFGNVAFKVTESNSEHPSTLGRIGYIAIGILIGLSIAGLGLVIWAIGFEQHREKAEQAVKTCVKKSESVEDKKGKNEPSKQHNAGLHSVEEPFAQETAESLLFENEVTKEPVCITGNDEVHK